MAAAVVADGTTLIDFSWRIFCTTGIAYLEKRGREKERERGGGRWVGVGGKDLYIQIMYISLQLTLLFFLSRFLLELIYLSPRVQVE